MSDIEIMRFGERVVLTGDDAAEFAAVQSSITAIPTARERTKVTLYERMTDSELAAFEAALAGLPVRQRMLWSDATAIDVSRADVQTLAAALFGAERAAVILA